MYFITESIKLHNSDAKPKRSWTQCSYKQMFQNIVTETKQNCS